MTTDRELLELAAKAHGGVIFNKYMNYPIVFTGKEKDRDKIICWNPLDDEEDALLLAIKLGIGVYETAAGFEARKGPYICCLEDGNGGRHYRRAIVRAAAEIGRAMQ